MVLARSALELLAEHEELHLIVDGQNTGTSNAAKDVSTSALEKRSYTLLGDDLPGSVNGRAVLDGLERCQQPSRLDAVIAAVESYLSRSHHHATTNGIQRIRGNSSTCGDTPAKQERGEEVAFKGADEDNRLDRVVHAKVEPTVDNNTGNRGHEATIETPNTVRRQSFLVHVDETVELTCAPGLRVLVVVG